MKKKLLFAALAMSCAMSSFALEEGDYVYTKTGRVHVTGQNLFETGSTNLEGWTDATSSAVNNEVWAVEPGAGPEGEDVIQSQNAATENAALARFFSLDPGQYVISYQIKAAGETNSGTTTTGTTVGNNYMGIFLNTTGELNMAASTEEAPVVAVSSTENFTEDWKTVSYFITVEEGSFLVFHLEKMSVGMQVTNFSVNAAEEVYDIRIAQNKIAFAKQLLNDPNFNTPEAAGAHANLNDEVIPTIEGMIAANGMDDATTAEDIMNSLNEALNEYLDASSVNIAKNSYFNYVEDIRTVPSSNRGNISNGQKVGGFVLRGNNWFHQRGKDESGQRTLLDNPYWTKYIGYGQDNGPGSIGLWNDLMPAGKYYIAATMRNCTEVKAGKVWDLECAVKAFVGTDSIECGTIKGEDFVKFYFVGELKEGEPFEAGFYWDGPHTGSTFQIGEFEIRSFNEVEDVIIRKDTWNKFIAQYNAMVSARDNVLKLQAKKKDYPWDQSVLEAALNKYDPYYNDIISKGWITADGQDSGVATNDELADWTLYQGVEEYSEPTEEGAEPTRLTYQVVRGYQNAYNAVVAANKPIADLLAAINNAKSERNNPKNVNGDKSVIDPVINAVTEVYKEIYANTNDERRQADEATIEAQIAALEEAIKAFKATTDVKPFVDIDFSLGVQSDEAGTPFAIGAAGQMALNPYSENNDEGSSFALGYTDVLTDVLRVGKGTAVVEFEAPADGDILEFNFDMWWGNLINRTTGIALQNANGTRVAGFTLNRYNGVVGYNEFNNEANTGMDINAYVTGIGSRDAANGAICVDNNKSTFKLVVNYAEGTVQGTVTNAQKGTCTGEPIKIQEMEDNKITRFVITSDYDNKDRRCWFDNLKIFKFSGAAGIQGDVNGDDTVDVSDISAILTAMASGSSDPAADVNGDGTVDVADISATLTIMAGGTVE